MVKILEALTLSPTLPAKNVVIWLHGLGADGHDFVDLVPELRLPETLAVKFIFPHAPIRPVTLNGGLPMRAWFDLYGLAADARADEAGVLESDSALRVLIKQQIEQGIPAENIALVGFSQGGALALYSGLTYPKRLGGILGLSTFLPVNALKELHQPTTTPIAMMHGEYDSVVLPVLAHTARDYLIAHHYSVKWSSYPMAHTICAAEIRDISLWLTQIFTPSS